MASGFIGPALLAVMGCFWIDFGYRRWRLQRGELDQFFAVFVGMVGAAIFGLAFAVFIKFLE